jgi:hypothetical protein
VWNGAKRHRESDERQHSSGEAENTKMAKLETTRADDTNARREVKEGNSSENGGTCGSSDVSSNGDASRAGRDKEIGGSGKEGFLT